MEKKFIKEKEIKKLKRNNLTIDISNKIIIKNNIVFTISIVEVKILQLLISKKDKIFSRKEILNFVLEYNHFNHSDYRIIDFYISKLRYKIEDEPRNPIYLQTIRGLGYKFFQEKFFIDK